MPRASEALEDLTRASAREHERTEGLVQVDDMDTVALRVDIRLHLRIPALGLVSEVDARLQHLLHDDIGRIWK